MIPADELERFKSCTEEAWRLAAAGQILEGYEVLDLGLTWAETPALNPVTWEQSPPDPWSAELISLYRHELMRYVAGYRFALGSRCVVRRAQALRWEARALRASAESVLADSVRLRRRCEKLPRHAGPPRPHESVN